MEIENKAIDAAAGFTIDADFLNFGEDSKITDTLKTGGSDSAFNGETASFEFAEEDLEWLTNMEAFPPIESCVGLLPDDDSELKLNHLSPASVLDPINANGIPIANSCDNVGVFVNHPKGIRSKKDRQRKMSGYGELSIPLCEYPDLNVYEGRLNSSMWVRRCLHCQVDKTPQWREGPMGPKTLCNACGVRYKSGRLLPEYRPACSPTFSSNIHSNSHRKVLEMRMKKVGG